MTTRSQNNFLRTPFAAALLPLLVSACVVGPDYQAPAATTAQRITGQPLPAETVSTPVKGGESQKLVEGGVLPERWWTLFGSPAIDGWVDEAIRNSPSLAIAEATLRQAEANYRAATGAYYPSVTAGAGASRQKISGASAGGGFPGSIFNLYNASVTVSYALDLWGGVQRAVEGQGALVEAQRRQSQAAYLTLAGNVVTSAIALASADAQLKTARDIAAAYVDTVKLVEKRLEIGAGTRAEVIAVASRKAQADVIAARVLSLKKSDWRFEAMDARAVELLEEASERWRHLTDALRSPVWTHGTAAGDTADLRQAAQDALDALMDDALVLAARCIGRETRRFKVPLLSRGFQHPHFEAIEAPLRAIVDGVRQLANEVDDAVTAVAQTGTPRLSPRDLEALVDTLRSRSAAAREVRELERQ